MDAGSISAPPDGQPFGRFLPSIPEAQTKGGPIAPIPPLPSRWGRHFPSRTITSSITDTTSLQDTKGGPTPMTATAVPFPTLDHDAPTPRPLGRTAASAHDATKIYGSGDTRVVALDQVRVSFESGRLSAIMGPSGSGKSTLMHCLAGLDQLTSGQAFIGDVDLTSLSERSLTLLRRDRVGFIFQAFNLVPTLTALENITLPMDLAGTKPDKDWLRHVIETVGLADRVRHRPAELSGGQQQRVAVARALASRPEIIFADEPTGNLDSRTGSEILDFMRAAVHQLGQTIVMVTHDPVAAGYADRVVFLADGRIVDEMYEPTADSVLERMRHLD